MTAVENSLPAEGVTDLSNGGLSDNDEEPSFSDPEGYVDEGLDSEPSLVELRKSKPTLNPEYDDVIIIDNVPQVGEDRLDKLRTAMSKILVKFGRVIEEWYPMDDETAKTTGYMMVQFDSDKSSFNARKQLDGYRLDKSHQFVVKTLKEFDKAISISADWQKPKLPDFVECPTLLSWMLQEDGIDQFCIECNPSSRRTNAKFSAVYLNTLPQARLVLERQNWTEKTLVWSTRGTYIATLYGKGLIIWGGEGFDRLARIAHQNVGTVSFSPCENYVITSAWLPDSHTAGKSVSVYVSDIVASSVRRTFVHDMPSAVGPSEPSNEDGMTVIVAGGEELPQWLTDPPPMPFKWSYDGRYFARISGQDNISVYSSQTYALLDKRSLRVPMVASFDWAPAKEYRLATYQSEHHEVPARLSVISLVDRSEIRGNNMYNVAKCNIYWQSNGDYVCFHLDRYVKQKIKEEGERPQYINLYQNFEIFRMRDRGCPIETVEVKSAKFLHFSWEPNGARFCIIYEPVPGKVITSIRKVSQNGIEEIKTFCLDVNHAEWSPNGAFVVLASFRGRMSNRLYFIDASDLSVMADNDHPMMSVVSWDPTSRYVVSCAFASSQTTDAGYVIWSFQGRKLSSIRSAELVQFSWRPRHPSLLSELMLKDIRRNIKQYGAKFRELDELSASKLSADQVSLKRRLTEEFAQIRKSAHERLQQQAAMRQTLRRESGPKKPNKYEEEMFDFLLSIDEDMLKT